MGRLQRNFLNGGKTRRWSKTRYQIRTELNNYFAWSNPHPPHSRAYDREHGCVNSSMVFERLGAYGCSTSFALRALSTCLCVKLHLPISRTQTSVPLTKPSPFQKETRRGIKRSCLCAAQSNKHKSITLSEPQGTLKTRRLASCSGGTLGGIHWRAALAGCWVGAWCRSIANADSNIKSNNPFLSGGEQNHIK